MTKDRLFAIKTAFLLCCIVQITACTSTNKPATSAPTNKQAAQAKEQQRKAKTQILNYAKADADYKSLVEKLEQGDALTSDFDQIIRIYPLTTKYQPYANVEQAQKLLAFEFMEQQNWTGCLQATRRILAENYTSLTGHYGAMVCYNELDQSSKSAFHRSMLDGFMGAIWRSGDGKSPASAFYITSSNDLFAFVQLNGMVATGQSLVYYEQRPIDVIKIENPETKREDTWYFDVTAQFRRGMFDDIERR